LSPEQAVDFVLQACEALAEAHTLGIVHRDLKPANLFCIQRTDGQFSVKVLDFGISKLTTVGASINQMTKTSAVMGSPLYMSPEQMKSSRAVDARTDIWSLGMILFELMTGRHAFDAETVTELAIKVATERAAPLRSFRADAPVGLEQVIAKCLERDRDTRFQTVGELATALEEFAPPHARLSVDRVLGTLRRAGGGGPAPQPAGEARAIAVSSPSLPGAGVPPPQTNASWGQTAPGAGGSGKVVAGVAALLSLGAIVVLGIAVLHGRGATEARPATGAGVASVTATAPSAPAPAPAASTNTAAVAASPAAPVAAPEPARPAAVPPATAHRAPRGVPVTTAPAAAPTAAVKPKANCDPPYYFDARGTRVFKEECTL
jgi:serine/threonine-protein kinase